MKQYSSYLVALLGLVGIAIVVLILITREPNPSVNVTDAETTLFAEASVITYDAAGGESIKVELVGDLARVSGLGYDQVVLRQVPAASGARYEGGNGLIFHTKGGEARLETAQSVIFSGTERAPLITEEPPAIVPTTDATTTEATSTTESLIASWKVVSSTLPDFTPDDFSDFGLTFSTDGTVAGATDCNSVGGNYTVEGDKLTFGPLMQTEMYCEGSFEQPFTAFLSAVASYSISEDALVLTAEDGETMMFGR